MNKYIKWTKHSTIVIILIIAVVTVFNYKIDSLCLFGNSNYLLQAAKAITNGNRIAGLKNYDDRSFQKLIIKNLQIKTNIITIGSSRTMQLRKQFLPQNKMIFFNHSVSGASLEDYIAIIGLYESIHNYIPKTIILGIDPWVFNRYNGQTRWKTLIKYYNFEMEKISGKKISAKDYNSNKWKELINYDYTLSNIKKFLKGDTQSLYTTNNININDMIKDTDGSIHYPYNKRHQADKITKQMAISYTHGQVYSLFGYNMLSNIKIFEKFIDYLQVKKVNVIFFLPPYNPITYDLLIKNKKYKYINIAEQYLNKFAIKNDIKLKGSYNPHKYNFKNKDFLDGMHGHDWVTKIIFKTYSLSN